MNDTTADSGAMSLSAALCIGGDAFDRLGRVLRHLVVGLVDQAVHLRLLGSDARVGSLTLGPIQTIVHGRVGWPLAQRRIQSLLASLSAPPPTTVHALSAESYRVAGAIAEAFEADLVVGVSSLADCEAATELSGVGVGRFLVLSEPLGAVLENQLRVPPDRIEVIRPGVRSSDTTACYSDAGRAATLLCTSPFECDSGVDRLLQAVKIVRERDHELYLFLMGRGRQEAALRQLAVRYNLSSCVTFANPLGDAAHAMRHGDIFIWPSHEQVYSVDGLQAMGSGMAVVAVTSSACDYLRDGETAVVCDKPSADSLAGAIERLLIDRDYARRLADAGLEYVRSKHTISDMAQRTAGAYRELALSRATFRIKE